MKPARELPEGTPWEPWTMHFGPSSPSRKPYPGLAPWARILRPFGAEGSETNALYTIPKNGLGVGPSLAPREDLRQIVNLHNAVAAHE